jgi:2-oxo-4-hydroxy-4-carboxy--5-ureidoimidazoline (OHCU) decarboxylase
MLEILKNYKEGNVNEVIDEVKKLGLNQLDEDQYEGFVNFINDCTEDVKMGFLLYLVDTQDTKKNIKVREFLKRFQKDLIKLRQWNINNSINQL